MDTLTPAARSRVMRAVRGKATGVERRLAAALKARGLQGYVRNAKLPGSPNLAYRAARVAVFVHGCFWHACSRHYRAPKSSFRHAPGYWAEKARRNQARDRRVQRELRAAGWRVVVVWEHDHPGRAAARVHAALAKARNHHP